MELVFGNRVSNIPHPSFSTICSWDVFELMFETFRESFLDLSGDLS